MYTLNNVVYQLYLNKIGKKQTKHYCVAAAAAAKSLQLCPTLCDPIDGSPPGSPTPGILQGRTLEWVAISFSNAWKWKVKGKLLSHVWLLATPWTAAHQAPPGIVQGRVMEWGALPSPIVPQFSHMYMKIKYCIFRCHKNFKKFCASN